MPDNKEKKQSWRPNVAQLVAAAEMGPTSAEAAETDRKQNLSMFNRKKEATARKRGKEKARREVSARIYGDRDMKPPKKGDAAAAKKAADAAIDNLNKQVADINRRSAKGYKGENPLTTNEARAAKRTIGRKMIEAVDSSKQFISGYEYKDSSGRTVSVGDSQISGRGPASSKRGAGDGTFGEQAFGGEAGRVRAAAEKLAGKNYSGSRERKGVYAKNQDGRIEYVKPKKGASVTSRRAKFAPRVLPTRGRPKGSGYDPDAGPFKKGQGPS